MISLTVIHNRRENEILRLLRSAKQDFDELVLVAAYGKQEHDRTREFAEEWCRENEKKFVYADYLNSSDAQGVDNFAYARNYAESLATQDWILWLDTDDILTSPGLIRKLLGWGKVFSFGYDYGNGQTFQRDRVWLRSAKGYWINQYGKMHEKRAFEKDIVRFESDLPLVRHIPAHRPDRDSRSTDNGTIRNDLSRATDTELFFDAWKRRIPDYTNRVMHRMINAKCDPRAICALAMTVGNDEVLDHYDYRVQAEMIRYARETSWWGKYKRGRNLKRLIKTEQPKAPLYFSTELWSWGLRDILPGSGKRLRNPKITVIHATRGRPWEAVLNRQRWLNYAKHPETIDYVFALDSDDTESIQTLGHLPCVIRPNKNVIEAWNSVKPRGKWVIANADDISPPLYWDEKISPHTTDKKRLIATSDGCGEPVPKSFLHLFIGSYALWKSRGYVYNPDYTGVYADNEELLRAIHGGYLVSRYKELTFQHLNPHHDPALAEAADEVSGRINNPDEYGRNKLTFIRRNREILNQYPEAYWNQA